MSDIFKHLFPSSSLISELEPLGTIGEIMDGLELLSLAEDCIEPIRDTNKSAYIKSKIYPTDHKEKARLERKLALTYSDKQANQLQLDELLKSPQDLSQPIINTPKLISKKSKLESYAKELSEEYDELERLKQEEKDILETYTYHFFKPERLKQWYFESDQVYASRVASYEAEARKEFVKNNRDQVLLNALKAKIIRETPNFSGEATLLEKEDKAQTLLTPFYNQRKSERYQEIEKIKIAREDNRYYSTTPQVPKKHLTNDAPELNLSVGMHYRYALLQKELQKTPEPEVIDSEEKEKRLALIEKNKKRSNTASYWSKNATDTSVWQGKAKPFKKLV